MRRTASLFEAVNKYDFIAFSACEKQGWFMKRIPVETRQFQEAKTSAWQGMKLAADDTECVSLPEIVRKRDGMLVHQLARRWYSKQLPCKSYLVEQTEFETALQATEERLALKRDGEYFAIHEGAFQVHFSTTLTLRTKPDILHWVPKGEKYIASKAVSGGGWELLEVKSFLDLKGHENRVSLDCGFQKFVLSKMGIDIQSCGVIHMSRSHLRLPVKEPVRNPFLLSRLFTVVEIDPIETDAVSDQLKRFDNVLQDESKQQWRHSFETDHMEAMKADVNWNSSCSSCPFRSRCVPDPKKVGNTVFQVPQLPAATKANLWNSGFRTPDDIHAATSGQGEEIAKMLTKHFSAGSSQRKFVDASVENKAIVEKHSIHKFMNDLSYPVIVLDFETAFFAVPPWKNLGSMVQTPFQFSAHVFYQDILIEKPEHHFFLHCGGGFSPRDDPRTALIQRLIQMFQHVESRSAGKSHRSQHSLGTFVAHHAAFEKGCLQRLWSFGKKQDIFDRKTLDRFHVSRFQWADTMILAKNGFIVPGAGGSFSLKKLFPALRPDLAGKYSEGLVSDGLEASARYRLLAAQPTEPSTSSIQEVRDALLRYCELDTLAAIELIRQAVVLAESAE